MSEKFRYLLQKLVRKTWWRCALFSLFAVLAVALAALLGPAIPRDVATQLGSDSIDSLLNILASSMLTVAIFSATTMVSSFSAVSSTATPRAAQLLIEDTTIQNTLAAFVGAFLYSVIALVGLHAHVYGDGGRLVLFGFTLVMLAVVVVVLLRWIDYLSVLGRLGETIRRVELATADAMRQRLDKPHLGGRPQAEGERGAHALQAAATGFVQHVSMDLLQRHAEAAGCRLHLHVLPGAFVEPSVVLVTGDRPFDDAARQAIADAVLVGTSRSFDHDPRFGMVVMGEIAARAMSASVNDPGTALDVTAAAVRTLAVWAEGRRAQAAAPPEVLFDRVSAPALRDAGLVEDVFAPLARYGAPAVEVGIALQRALGSVRRLGHPPFAAAAEAMARYALARAGQAGLLPEELSLLQAAAGAAASAAAEPQPSGHTAVP
ncbi:DUF2254 domain-containing protein [uncultured Xylophilus sp.]|uniref:DUF2254 domain-containing protein n=1 Tax=uncultured Xylophilus sp. TaxID=296832 RepID=UPI0025E1DC62|nr:DUF2254 domain-containing protein [uncultured Xylophilus sp.]